MKHSSYLSKNIEIIDKTLSQAIKLTARRSYFKRIQSILVNTDIEKPPNSFLADRLDGFSIYFVNHNSAPHWGQQI